MLAATALADELPGAIVTVAGLVTMRQRPATASGVTFVTIEDETGPINIIVWRELGRRQRREQERLEQQEQHERQVMQERQQVDRKDTSGSGSVN